MAIGLKVFLTDSVAIVTEILSTRKIFYQSTNKEVTNANQD